MPKMKLTKSTIDRVAKPGVTEPDALYSDTDSKGFGLRVTPTGLAKFITQGRVRGSGKEIRVALVSTVCPHVQGVFRTPQHLPSEPSAYMMCVPWKQTTMGCVAVE